MRDAVKRKCCPKCGGKIVVSFLYQTSHDYEITKRGKLSKRFTRDGEHTLDCAIASCSSCDLRWEDGDFYIQDGCFYDWSFAEDEEVSE